MYDPEMEYVILAAVVVSAVVVILAMRGRLRRTHEAVRSLQKDQKRITKQLDSLKSRLQQSHEMLKTGFKVSRYDFDNDCLRVWGKTVDFLEDPRFKKAYEKGMFSGHRISGEYGVDLHIEWRIHVLCWAASQAIGLKGDFVECGVNTGIFSLAICDYTDFAKYSDRTLYLFDTYEGIPREQITETEKQHKREEFNKLAYEDCFDQAKQNFAHVPNAELVKGRVPESLEAVEIASVAYLSIDMNIVEPEIAALEFFWDKLVPGALVVLDDYGWGDHVEQKRAIDAFALDRGTSVLNLPTGQGLMIKGPGIGG
ncbi:MAG: O-methyltransferase [Verrucomicrobiales bacterium]|jgi:O-methyltransferase